MRRGRVWTDEDGTASLEFIVVGLVLLVPIVYLVIAFGSVQARAMGIEAAARHVARAVATAPDDGTAGERADRVLAAIAAEYDLAPETIDLTLSCRPEGARCPEAGVTLTVELTSVVDLPLVPAIFGLDRLTEIPVTATSVQKVSRLWSEGP